MDLIFKNYIKLTRFFIPLSVWYFLIDDGGGLSLKNSHIILIISLLTVPDIIILSKLYRNSLLLLALLNVITLASFYNSNYKDQYPWGLRFTLLITLGYVIGMMIKGMSGISQVSVAIIAFFMTIPEGLRSWKVTLLIGEERLWRFLPWHNPTGIVYGAFFLIFTICIQRATNNIHKLLLAFFASASCSFLILSGSRASIYITLLFFIIYCIFFMGLKNSIINTGILSLLIISEISILVHQKGTFSKNGFDYSSGNAISSGSLSIFGRTSSAGDNFLARTKFWMNAIGIFKDNILLGSGPGSWASVSWFNRSPNETLSTAVHNDYLQFLAEYGLIFFFIICTIIFLSLMSGFKSDRNIFILPILVMLLHSAVDFNIHYPIVWFFIFVMLGLNATKEVKSKYWYYGFILIIVSSIPLGLIADKGAGQINDYELGKTANLTQVASFNYIDTMKSYKKLAEGGYYNLAQNQLDYYLLNNPKDYRIIDLNNYTKAKNGNSKAFKILEKDYKKHNWIQTYFYLSELYVSENRKDSAERVLSEAERMIERNPGWENYMNYVLLATEYSYAGNKFSNCKLYTNKIYLYLSRSLDLKSSYVFWDQQTPLIKKYCPEIIIPKNQRLKIGE